MHRLFLDESGECSFSERSAYKHFLLTVLSIDPADIKKIRNRLKRKRADFINKGWDKSKEIKAYELYKDKKVGRKAVSEVLTVLSSIDTLEISYIVVNKNKIKQESFKESPYGIAYNYFTGVLISELIFNDGIHNVHITYDKKNKETHLHRHFKEYLHTKIYGLALEKDLDVNLEIIGDDSTNNYGLSAVDYFSWALFRKFEHKDDSFFELFSDKLKRRREWYL